MYNILKDGFDNKNLIVFDFEVVEGLNYYFSRPHQLAWRQIHKDKLIEEKSTYIKWPTPFNVSADAARIVRYNQSIIDELGRPAEQVFNKFHTVIYNPDNIIIGHNILSYDVMIFHNSCKKLGLKCDYSFLERCIDTNALFKIYKLGRTIDSKNFLAEQFNANNFVRKGLKSNVAFACQEFNIPVDETKSHEALYDTQLESEIFFKVIQKINFK